MDGILLRANPKDPAALSQSFRSSGRLRFSLDSKSEVQNRFSVENILQT